MQLDNGKSVTVDAAYIAESAAHPGAKVVAGFSPIMPQFHLSATELAALVAYIQALGAPQ